MESIGAALDHLRVTEGDDSSSDIAVVEREEQHPHHQNHHKDHVSFVTRGMAFLLRNGHVKRGFMQLASN